MSEVMLDKLRDLYKQSTTEHSHYYVASCVAGAIEEIKSLTQQLEEAKNNIQVWRESNQISELAFEKAEAEVKELRWALKKITIVDEAGWTEYDTLVACYRIAQQALKN